MDDTETAVALRVLARLVRQDNPERPLAEIAEVWGDATPEEIEALRRVEPTL